LASSFLCWLLVNVAATDHLKRPRRALRRLREREYDDVPEHGERKEDANRERMEEYSLYYLMGFADGSISFLTNPPITSPVPSPTKSPTTTVDLPTELPSDDNTSPTTNPVPLDAPTFAPLIVSSPPNSIESTDTPTIFPGLTPTKAPAVMEMTNPPNTEGPKSTKSLTRSPTATKMTNPPNMMVPGSTKGPTRVSTLAPNTEGSTKSPTTEGNNPSPPVTSPPSSCPDNEDVPDGSEEWQQQTSIPGPTGARWGWSADISSDASTVVASGYLGSIGNASETGIVGTYALKDTHATPIGQVGGKAADQLGNSVSMSGDGRLLAVAARGEGYGQIYRTDDMYLIDEIQIVGDSANIGLSKDGTKAVVLSDSFVGVYQVSHNDSQLLGNPLPGHVAGDPFGKSWDLSEDGEIIVLGSKAANANTGNAKVYQYGGTGWEQVGNDLNGTSSEDYFGAATSLSANGKRIAIGARQRTNIDGIPGSASGQGYVQVFDYNGTGWNQVGDTLSGQSDGDQFGIDVSLSDDGKHLIVGANVGGYVRVFREICGSWLPLGGTTSSNQDEFGYSVGISNDGETFIATSFPYPDATVPGGAVDVFRLVNI